MGTVTIYVLIQCKCIFTICKLYQFAGISFVQSLTTSQRGFGLIRILRVCFRKTYQGCFSTICSRNILHAQIETFTDLVRNSYVIVFDAPVGFNGCYLFSSRITICRILREVLDRLVPRLLIEGRGPTAIGVRCIVDILECFRLLLTVVRSVDIPGVHVLQRGGHPAFRVVGNLEFYPSLFVIQVMLIHQLRFRLEVDLVYLVNIIRGYTSVFIRYGHVVLDI